jgi:hypothetical protein
VGRYVDEGCTSCRRGRDEVVGKPRPCYETLWPDPDEPWVFPLCVNWELTPSISKDRLRRSQFVKTWMEEHGPICPGFDRPPHPSEDLTADYVVPVGLGGSALGELRCLCGDCNTRRCAALGREAADKWQTGEATEEV